MVKKKKANEDISCHYCGTSNYEKNDGITIKDNICNECEDFYKNPLDDPRHYTWIIEFSLQALEKEIEKIQLELLHLKELKENNFEICKYKIRDTERSINAQRIQLNHFYKMHKWLIQAHKMAKFRNIILSATGKWDSQQ